MIVTNSRHVVASGMKLKLQEEQMVSCLYKYFMDVYLDITHITM